MFAPLVNGHVRLRLLAIDTVGQGLALVPSASRSAALSVPLVDGCGIGSRRLAEWLLAPRGRRHVGAARRDPEETRRMTLRRAGEAIHAALPLQAALTGSSVG